MKPASPEQQADHERDYRKHEPDSYTIWKNGSRYEWLIRHGEYITKRSGMIYSNYSTARREMLKALAD